jgi:hypothetical protein
MSRHLNGTTPAVALRYQKARTLQTVPRNWTCAKFSATHDQLFPPDIAGFLPG